MSFQVILPLLKSDLYEVIQSTLDGLLCASLPVWLEDRAAIPVVMASQGYPGDYAKGAEITGECWKQKVDFNVTNQQKVDFQCHRRPPSHAALLFLRVRGHQKSFRGSAHNYLACWI